ncbi:MAG TPA: hypothetical protein VMV73_06530 [Candidatus Dormibacteraeota bacterium]|nr:hypothetical protein [Candidatus Dormibacteraeota bacterium]
MNALRTASHAFIRHGSLRVEASLNRDFELAKKYLDADSVERGLFERLEDSRTRTFTMRTEHRNNDRFDPNDDTIWWDPTSALRTTSGGAQSPALGLGHEVDHAVERPSRETQLSSRRVARYDTAEEERVIRGSETHAARTLGEAVRYDHDGRCFRVASPTAR